MANTEATRREKPAHDMQTIRATIDIVDDRERGIRIDLARCFQAHLGLRLRTKDAEECIRRVTTHSVARWQPPIRELTLPAGSVISAEKIAWKLGKAFAEIAWRPLTPRMLLMALNITSQERLRWTKDGRLRTSGQIQVRKGGGLLSVPTYPVSVAEELTASPDIVSAWRDQDAAN